MLKHINEQNFEKEIKCGISIVDFYALWCGPCLIIDKMLKDLSSTKTEYNVLKIDVDKSEKLVHKLKIDTIPCLHIYRDGMLMDKIIGCISKDELLNIIENM